MASHDQLPAPASEGFSDASAYDQYRPSYASTTVEQFLQKLGLAGQSESNIVEIAAGTGKFTELLAARPERFNVKAIEPHNGMRAKLEEKDLQGVEVLEGLADKMPVEDQWGDALIAAQAFHWFANDNALKEIERVLRPGAVFGMIWNIEEYNKPKDWPASTKWEQKLNEFIWSLDDGLPRFRHLKWRGIFEQHLPGNPFQVIRDTISNRLPNFSLPIGEATVKWTVWLTEEALWSRFNTLSQVAALKGEEREKASKLYHDIMSGADVERNEKGEVAVHGITYYAWTDRL